MHGIYYWASWDGDATCWWDGDSNWQFGRHRSLNIGTTPQKWIFFTLVPDTGYERENHFKVCMIVNYVEAWTLKANVQMTVIQHCRIRSHCSPKKGPFASSFYLSYKCDYLKDSLLVDTFQKEKDNSLVKYTLDTRLLNYCGKIRKKCRPDPFWGSSAKGHWKQLFCGPRILQRAPVPKKGHFLRPTKGLCWCISIQHCPFVPFWLKWPSERIGFKTKWLTMNNWRQCNSTMQLNFVTRGRKKTIPATISPVKSEARQGGVMARTVKYFGGSSAMRWTWGRRWSHKVFHATPPPTRKRSSSILIKLMCDDVNEERTDWKANNVKY